MALYFWELSEKSNEAAIFLGVFHYSLEWQRVV